MSSPGTAMANTFQKPVHIFPLPYSLLAWGGFSPVPGSDGEHFLFYNKIIGSTQIIPFPKKSLLGRSLVLHSKQNVLEEKTTIPCCITFFVIKKAKRKSLVRVEHINYDKTS